MKVLYDNFIFQHQTIGGISRYCYELMNYYYKSKCLDFKFPIYYSLNQYIQNAPFTPQMNFYMKSFLCKIGEFRSFLRKKNKSSVIRELKSKKYDIFHPSYFDDYFLDALDKAPNTKLVITIYDMIIEAFADEFGENEQKLSRYKDIIAHRADKIFTISEFSKSEILKYYPDITEDKVKVIHLASALKEKEENISLTLPEKYLLFVGARRFYKNFKFMLNSIAPLIKEKQIPLVVASPWDFDEEETKIINDKNISNLIIHMKPTDGELAHLYKNALCYIFPSMYEGFGIPVLEAFEFDCPVITSNIASLPEVGSYACEYFDPKDENSIYETVKKVVENDDLRQQMKINGKKRLEDFSWEKTAIKTMQEYERVLN